jgi:diguanylate cyclase (GGDEF)-like protein/PAS domain S-box-containing protein
MALHPLLVRQLRRVGIDPASGSDPLTLQSLLERVSRAYEAHDQELYLLERSQDLASREMAALYATVRADRDLLDSRVHERTEALRSSEGRLSSLLSLSADWVWEQDMVQRFVYVSDGVEQATGLSPSSLLGRCWLAGELDGANAQPARDFHDCFESRRAFRDLPWTVARPDGSILYLRVSGEPTFDEGGNFRGFRGIGSNVTQAVLAEQKVQQLARFDSLTGLPNRNMFLGELDRAIAQAHRRQGSLALCFIDLDRFKVINDTLGHGAGDELLQMMARRLCATVREGDIVARLGGDEFVVLLEDAAKGIDPQAIGQKLLAAICEPLQIQGNGFLVTGSIGIGQYPADGEDAATLLKHADAAMYLAKGKGKNNIQVYTAELAHNAARAFELESALRLALVRQEFLLHYQPKINISTGQMCGVEALLRWEQPGRGMVAPNEFIPLAEERGLIVPIGRWVIGEACRQIAAWRGAGLEPPSVAVNLSACQFANDSLVDELLHSLQTHGVDPCDFEVELTESVLMEDPDRANHVLSRLHALGVRISIDDFGTGYSSLSYLKRFPAQTVKVDRSFVSGLPGDGDDAAITRAVIAMAGTLGMRVVAEGVETNAQLDALRAMGCDEAQGYLLGRPMPADKLAERLCAPVLVDAMDTVGALRFEPRYPASRRQGHSA